MAYMLDGWDLWESEQNLQYLLDTCDTQEFNLNNLTDSKSSQNNLIQTQIGRHGNISDHVNSFCGTVGGNTVHFNVVEGIVNSNNKRSNAFVLNKIGDVMSPHEIESLDRQVANETLLQGFANNQCNVYGHLMCNIEQGEPVKSKIASVSEETPKLLLPIPSGAERREGRPDKFFPCQICGNVLASKHNLKKHISITHNLEKPHECDICGRSFKRKGDLKSHKMIHNDDKPFACNACDRSFRRNGDLKEHLLTHSDSKPYHCHICGNRFTQHSTLRTHILTHSGEQRFSCDICGRQFSVKTNLTAHQLTHSKEQPFHCDVCGKKFSLKGNLKRHKSIHGEDT